jgi:hypothetical protein
MGRSSIHRLCAVACAAAAGASAAASAQASQLIDRNAQSVRLRVDARGQALLTYRTGARVRRVLAWGGVNAVAADAGRRQVRFRLDYSGGYSTFRRPVWRGFPDACRRYDGPPLRWLVTACRAPDGSYWAVQSWPRLLPSHGEAPSGRNGAWELRLSHWRGELPRIDIKVDWAHRRYHHLFGRYTYRGAPVFGFSATPGGAPRDAFGRNVYVDVFGSGLGPGWRRVNSFLTHRGSGAFCYGFFPVAGRPSAQGTRYRATVIGPGVTPDVTWEGAAPGPYDRALDALANEQIRALGSPNCRPN